MNLSGKGLVIIAINLSKERHFMLQSKADNPVDRGD